MQPGREVGLALGSIGQGFWGWGVGFGGQTTGEGFRQGRAVDGDRGA